MRKPSFEESVASVERARKGWSDRNIVDGHFVSPEEVFKFTKTKYWFNCDQCHHVFDTLPGNIANDVWCRYCAHLDLCNDPNCKMCFENSFASNPLKQYIHEDCKIDLRTIFKAGKVVLKFRCHLCTHVFDKPAKGINSKHWCPYCPKTSKILCRDMNCKMCMKNSFAFSAKAIFWSPKNKLKPRDVTISQPHKKYLFDCPRCENEFWKSPNDITKGGWCPFCKNKTEAKLFEELKKCVPSLEFQFYADWCRNKETNFMLPFDFVIQGCKVIIELDGDQHFEEIKYWKNDPEKQFQRDLYKMAMANQHGYTVIRVYQPDVHHNRINWLNRIIKAIQDVIREKPVVNEFGSMPSYFIASDLSIYDRFTED